MPDCSRDEFSPMSVAVGEELGNLGISKRPIIVMSHRTTKEVKIGGNECNG